MRKILKLTLALTILAGTAAGVLSSTRAEAACPTYCCPGAPTRCITCCTRTCDLNCP